MSPKERIILLQKQLSIAVKALKILAADYDTVCPLADEALEEIERIKLVQEGTRS